METLGIDVLISAPQKSWSSPPCAGFVMLSDSALEQLQTTTSNSFANDLKQWQQIMNAYLDGGHAHHATMPTDALRQCRDTMQASCDYGLSKLATAQISLGSQIRALLNQSEFPSVAAEGWHANGVIVCYTDNVNIHNGSAFAVLLKNKVCKLLPVCPWFAVRQTAIARLESDCLGWINGNRSIKPLPLLKRHWMQLLPTETSGFCIDYDNQRKQMSKSCNRVNKINTIKLAEYRK